jgi:hypothetical protein
MDVISRRGTKVDQIKNSECMRLLSVKPSASCNTVNGQFQSCNLEFIVDAQPPPRLYKVGLLVFSAVDL